MKLSDYVVSYLANLGIRHVFLMTGGACAHLVDSFSGRTDIDYVCVHHEQAAAMAAECYARTGPGLGAAMATSGPGATNLITGICCAWFDSIPALYITGQVNTFESKHDSGVRQVGFQETDIVTMVKPVTKLARVVDRAERIRYDLDEAVHVARSGRPGPVLLDIPMDVQRADIDPGTLPPFVAPQSDGPEPVDAALDECVGVLKRAERPVMLLGGGIRYAGGADLVRAFVDTVGIPVVCSWSGFDLLPHDHPLFVGQIGVYGNRGANFAIQNADVLLAVGSRLDTRQTGGRPETFAREATKIVVDIDPAELAKRRGLTPDVAICSDARRFMERLTPLLRNTRQGDRAWLARTREWRNKYPGCPVEAERQSDHVNPYVFAKQLSDWLPDDAVIIPECGANLVWMMQAFEVKGRQRVISAFGNSPMGYALPASIGASFARPGTSIICILGDGGLQVNMQELQTVVFHRLPIKIFVLDNRGYGIIKQFQEMYFSSRYEATGRGYSHPDFDAVATAYGMPSLSIGDHGELADGIRWTLQQPGPVLCNIAIREHQKLIPKLEFGRPIEDLTPYLPRAEFLSNMIVPAHESSVVENEDELV